MANEDTDRELTDDDFTLLSNGGKVPKDGSWIPKDRFNEATQKLQGDLNTEHDAVIRLQEQIKALQTNQSSDTNQPPAKVYSLGELRAAVEKETISQDEADRIYERQTEAKFDKKLESSMATLKSETVNGTALSTSLNSYVELISEVDKVGSKNHTKLKDAYGRLTGTLGLPKEGSVEDQKMQLMAFETAFGPIVQLKQRLNSQSEADADRDTHQEFSNSDNQGPSGDTKFQKGLSKGRRDYYTKMIDKGMYPDWKAVEEEMKFVRT